MNQLIIIYISLVVNFLKWLNFKICLHNPLNFVIFKWFKNWNHRFEACLIIFLIKCPSVTWQSAAPQQISGKVLKKEQMRPDLLLSEWSSFHLIIIIKASFLIFFFLPLHSTQYVVFFLSARCIVGSVKWPIQKSDWTQSTYGCFGFYQYWFEV